MQFELSHIRAAAPQRLHYIPNAERLAVRWTIGDVRRRRFEMLRLSIACAFRLFGAQATYVVCVNSLPAAEARARVGPLPVEVEWRQVTLADLPPVLRACFDEGVAEGVGWKLAPLRTWPDRYELALDNDCMLWALPEGMRLWLSSADGGLLAEDVARCVGCFDGLCPPGAFNSGIRGLAPGDSLERSLAAVLAEVRGASEGGPRLRGEVDEQGLQTAAMWRMNPLFLVRHSEVSICSPFWPASPELGSCGAHFVGMNARHFPWNYYDRPADEWREEHWQRHRPALYERAGLLLPSAERAA